MSISVRDYQAALNRRGTGLASEAKLQAEALRVQAAAADARGDVQSAIQLRNSANAIDPPGSTSQPLTTKAKVALGFGAVVLVGGAAYALWPKHRRRNPRRRRKC